MLEFLGSFGQPTHCFWTVKTSRVDGWTKIVHVCCLQNIAYTEWLGVWTETNC